MPSLLTIQASPSGSVSESLGNVTFDEVKKAYDKLVAAGAAATTRAVHAEIGRGSRATVVPHVRTLRNASAGAEAPAHSALSAEIIRDLARELERQVKERTSRLSADLADCNESLDLVLQENQSLRSSLLEASTTIEALRTSAAEQLGSTEALRAQHDELFTRLKAAEREGEDAKKELALMRERLRHSEEKCAHAVSAGADAAAELSAAKDA